MLITAAVCLWSCEESLEHFSDRGGKTDLVQYLQNLGGKVHVKKLQIKRGRPLQKDGSGYKKHLETVTVCNTEAMFT